MTRKTALIALILALVAGTAYIGKTFAQDDSGRGRRGNMTDEERRERIEQWRAQIADQLRQKLGATEEEWTVLEPMLTNIQTLSGQLQAGGMRSAFAAFGGGRRGRGSEGDDGAEAAEAPEQTEIQKASQALQELADSETPSTEDLDAALEAYRAARAQIEDDLAVAREELRGVVTLKQEAQLVLMGILD